MAVLPQPDFASEIRALKVSFDSMSQAVTNSNISPQMSTKLREHLLAWFVYECEWIVRSYR